MRKLPPPTRVDNLAAAAIAGSLHIVGWLLFPVIVVLAVAGKVLLPDPAE